jgi:acetolactate synthase I/II/III large subunit
MGEIRKALGSDKAINDGGYGAETHKFRANGVDPMHATHGRGDLAQVARGFGLNAPR